ncbi:MAG: phycobiliprotein lyase [Cyanobacteria bacterium P01_A01_bin.123]
MDIVNFFEKLAGKWFSQRTIHDLVSQVSKSGQSDLQVDWVDSTSPNVAQLCQRAQLDPATALGGFRVSQNSLMDGETQRQQSTTFVVLLEPVQGHQGRLLRQAQDDSHPPILGYYALEDEILTLVSEADHFRAEERLWFANPNLRMRTNVLEIANDIHLTSFCSEIRLGTSRPSSE